MTGRILVAGAAGRLGASIVEAFAGCEVIAQTRATLDITDPVGEGKPSATAGSSFVKIAGDAVLLDGDKIDTCDGLSIPMNSTVTAQNQDFVSCSE